MKLTISKCRSCGAAIKWVTMAVSGKKNPIDAEPSPKGNIDVTAAGYATVLSEEYAEKARDAGIDLYVSHFATCPNSKQHRKEK